MSTQRPPPQEMGFTTRGLAWEWRQSWFFAFFLTFFLYWLPLVYMGLRVLQFRWIVYGLFYAVPLLLLGLVIGAGGAGPDGMQFSSLTIHRMWQAVWGFWVISLSSLERAREFPAGSPTGLRPRGLLETRAQPHPARRRGQAGAEGTPAAEREPVSEMELAMLRLGTVRRRCACARTWASSAPSPIRAEAAAAGEARARLRPLFEPIPREVALVIPRTIRLPVLPDAAACWRSTGRAPRHWARCPLGPESRGAPSPCATATARSSRWRISATARRERWDVLIKIGPYVSVISMSTRPGGGSDRKTGGRIVDV
jgi:hypothetical protein